MTPKRSFLPTRAVHDTVQRVWQHWIGPGAPFDEPVDLLVAPHDVPVWVSTIQARLPRTALTEPLAALIHGSGCGLTRLAAQAAACGEAIERYCASLPPGLPVVRTSAHALGLQGIAPSRFALFAEDQYATPGWHFRRGTATTVLNWVAGWSWTHQRVVSLPTCFVYQEPCMGAGQCLFHAVSTGLACATTAEAARLTGLCEVLERDAIMLAWLYGLELPRLRPPLDDPVLQELYQRIAATGLHATVLDATTPDTDLPVRIALVEWRAGVSAACAVGMAAHPVALQAHRKALLEACHTLHWLHHMQQHDPRPPTAGDAEPFAAFKEHVWHYGRAAAMYALDMWRCGPWQDEEAGPLPAPASPSRQFDELVCRLATHGLEVCTVDLTPPEVAQTGFAVVRTVVPGMQPLTPGRERCLGGIRLRTMATRLTCTARYGPDRWNPAPHPFP